LDDGGSNVFISPSANLKILTAAAAAAKAAATSSNESSQQPQQQQQYSKYSNHNVTGSSRMDEVVLQWMVAAVQLLPVLVNRRLPGKEVSQRGYATI
jgi:hypothetical protein